MLRSSILCLTSLMGLSACIAPPPPIEPAVEQKNIDRDVAAVERAFAATMAKRDFTAFSAFVADEAVFVSGRRTLRGKAQVLEAWKRFFEKPAAPFSWEPETVEVLDSGRLALSTGPVKTPDGEVVATFTSVWRYEGNAWRIIFDRGVDRTQCTAPEPMNASMVGRPDFGAYRQNLIQAQEAYGRKDFAAFLTLTQKAAEALPNSPRALYNVACGYALTGKPAEALGQLENLASMNLSFGAHKDDDLASLRSNPQFAAIVDRFSKIESTVVGKSTPAFTLSERDFIPEGIAYDSKFGSFFVGSVHKGKIMRIPPRGGAPTEFNSKDVDAVLGMVADPKRRALWACSSAIPEMEGYSDADKDRAKIVELDLDKGTWRRTVPLNEKGLHHMCNDLALDQDGNLFVSDPAAPMLYFLPSGTDLLEPYVPTGKFASPQGIAIPRDKKFFYVADYSRGLAHVDKSTHEVTWLSPPANATLLGIDGLTMAGDDLIAIQNGVHPHRVLRLAVDLASKSISKVETLQMNHSSFDEPTLGVVAGREFFYVANSHWGDFDKGQLKTREKLEPPVILKLKLE